MSMSGSGPEGVTRTRRSFCAILQRLVVDPDVVDGSDVAQVNELRIGLDRPEDSGVQNAVFVYPGKGV